MNQHFFLPADKLWHYPLGSGGLWEENESRVFSPFLRSGRFSLTRKVLNDRTRDTFPLISNGWQLRRRVRTSRQTGWLFSENPAAELRCCRPLCLQLLRWNPLLSFIKDTDRRTAIKVFLGVFARECVSLSELSAACLCVHFLWPPWALNPHSFPLWAGKSLFPLCVWLDT